MRTSFLGWLAIGVWAAWLGALQGLAARALPDPSWAPELAIALFASLAGSLSRHDLWRAALAVAAGRLAVSIEPPAAVIAGLLMVAALARATVGALDVERRPARALLAFALAAVFSTWLAFVHALAAEREAAAFALPAAIGVSLGESLVRSLAPACATAVAVFVCGPALARLPGTRPLRERRQWPTAAYSR